ncbi:MAG: PD-(D/E)XK nuclease family protein [Candidatus Marinimicrobia bacterium]|jgi:putative RecB family exonuclease|nr:PD-(D/E)XK nuclease family protein [Candidatus Neomarinimicrobiota bacterium]
MIERFSHSSLQTFKKCPAQFKIRYIDKVRKKDEGIEAFMGKRVHEAIEFLYETVLKGQIPFVDHIVDYYREIWAEHWHNRISRVDSAMKPTDYLRTGEECIVRYYRKHQPFHQPIKGNEVELDFFLDENKQYQMKGFIDRLDNLGNGHWEIHDYKTSKRALGQKAADNDEQLALYHFALKQKYKNVEKVDLVWHFLRHGIERRSSRTEEQLVALSNKCQSSIDTIRDFIQKGGAFYPKQSMLCNWCYYWEECSAKDGANPFIGRDR